MKAERAEHPDTRDAIRRRGYEGRDGRRHSTIRNAVGPVDGVWSEHAGQTYQKFVRDVGLPNVETLTCRGESSSRTRGTNATSAPSRHSARLGSALIS